MALLQSVIFLTLVSFNLFTIGHGWRLDPDSCNRHPETKARLLKALPKALDLVNNAVKKLEDQDQEIYGTRDLLFPKLALNKVDKPQDALKAISAAMTTNKGRGADYVDRRDPVIFCDLDRWKKKPSTKDGEPAGYVNTLTGMVDDGIKGVLKDCMEGKSICAYCSRFEGRDADKYQDYIQLCPWWLDSVKNDQAGKELEKWDNKKWSKMKIDHIDFGTERTWLDAIYRFERVLIHEFSHTSKGGKTLDLTGLNGLPMYQWQRCANPPPGLDMYTNADSLALFCVATDLVSNKMQRPTKDGNLERMCPGKDKCQVM